ncbi:MAG: UvrD-helicase domain-containing protein [Lentisphaerae bacterium]|nr:UvrD-helicase domain-containing protein [Lentisphaerota bacterium]
MSYLADLHVHSHLSRATSRECSLEGFCAWAQRKGIRVVATGDFTHPAWAAELKDKLTDAGNGLLKLRPELKTEVDSRVPTACRQDIDFILNVEISCIYKRDGAVRKVHALVFAPDFDAVDAINAALAKIGNLKADGRPILGLDCRDLLDIVLNASPNAWLVPAHIWTPWFSMLGSKSGFDSVNECFGDLAGEVFAAETGLSSDIPMNRLVSSLDRLALISNSDAHSPANLGRNATIFHGDPDYLAIRQALKTQSPTDFGGTLDLFPEEGKYHLDGHRACNVCLEPQQSRELNNLCPVCGKPLVLGVLHRVVELADRTYDTLPPNPIPYTYIIPLPELLAEINQCGATTKIVTRKYEALLAKYGPEDHILRTLDLTPLRRTDPLLAEALHRVRQRKVVRQGGYDGEYGRITVFNDDDRNDILRQGMLITSLPEPENTDDADSVQEWLDNRYPEAKTNPKAEAKPGYGRYDLPPLPMADASDNQPAAPPRQLELFPNPAEHLLEGLTDPQRNAASDPGRAVIIIAGPGAGKTRTLTRRIAWQVAAKAVPPEHVLAVTFTNRAAQEMRQRLQDLLGSQTAKLRVSTFHRFCLDVIRRHHDGLNLSADFALWDDEQAEQWLSRRRTLPLEHINEMLQNHEANQELLDELLANNCLCLQLLVPAALRLLKAHPDVIRTLNVQSINVDEWQDVSQDQYDLVKILASNASSLCVIGDPDQSIYSFRGASEQFFQQLQTDFPAAKRHFLRHNFRSDANIVWAANDLFDDAVRQSRLAPLPARGAIHKVRFFQAASPAAEAEYITHEIERWLGGVAHFSHDSQRAASSDLAALSLTDIAILVRLRVLVKPIADAINRLGLPVFTPELRDPNRIARTFIRQARALSPLRLQAPAAEAAAILQAIKTKNDAEAEWAAALLQNLEQFPGSLNDFLDHNALFNPADAVAKRGQRLTIMTCHAAKGLEFPVVFVAAAEDRFFPFLEGKTQNPDEERRLLYVAMTRAERVLYLTSAARRSCFGKTADPEWSRFLAKIPAELRDYHRDKPFQPSKHQADLQPFLPGLR